MKKILIFLGIGMILFISDTAAIYGSTWKAEELKRMWRKVLWKFGPFYIQPMLMLTNAGYDSNVYGTPSNKIKDYTFTAGPAFNIYLPIKNRILLSLYESPQYVYFFETARERTWNNYFNGQMYLLLNKFLISARAGLSDAREKWNTEIDIRPRRKEESVQGSILWQASTKTSFSISSRKARYDYESLEYEGFNIKEQLSREENYLNFVGYYQLSFRMKLFVDGEYGVFNFDNPLSLRDSRSYGIYGGFEFSPLAKIRGRIRLGYKFFDSLAPERQDFKGLVGDTNVQVKLLQRLGVRAMYKRNVQFSLWYDNTYFLENSVGGGASFYVHKKIKLDYDYSFGRNNYPQKGEQPPFEDSSQTIVKRKDDYSIHSVGIYYRLKQKVGIGVVLSKWVRNSNLDWEDDQRTFVGINLTYDF